MLKSGRCFKLAHVHCSVLPEVGLPRQTSGPEFSALRHTALTAHLFTFSCAPARHPRRHLRLPGTFAPAGLVQERLGRFVPRTQNTPHYVQGSPNMSGPPVRDILPVLPDSSFFSPSLLLPVSSSRSQWRMPYTRPCATRLRSMCDTPLRGIRPAPACFPFSWPSALPREISSRSLRRTRYTPSCAQDFRSMCGTLLCGTRQGPACCPSSLPCRALPGG